MKNYSKLRNESDIRGIAIEGVPGQQVNLTEEACRDIGRGFALWLIKRAGKSDLRVAVGRDSRLSGEKLLGWIATEMAKEGIKVTDMGLASTPAMFMTTKTEGYMFDGAVMVTASHLPYNRNGYKFFTPDGGVEASDIKEMIALAESGEHTGLEPAGIAKAEFMSVYSKRLADMIIRACGSEKPLEGLKIVVDAGNGAGGFFTEKVLRPLGADTEGSLYLEPDGMFPHHAPNPEDKAAITALKEAVLANRAAEEPRERVAIAGKCCESGDLIGVDFNLPRAKEGDLIAVLSTGAYNYSMASNYNRNFIPAAVLVKDGKARYIVKPQTYEDLVRNDVVPDDLK